MIEALGWGFPKTLEISADSGRRFDKFKSELKRVISMSLEAAPNVERYYFFLRQIKNLTVSDEISSAQTANCKGKWEDIGSIPLINYRNHISYM